MVSSTARVPTTSAERYAKQLCSHANHMGARASWTPPEGVVQFPHGGTCRVTAGEEELVVVLEAAAPADLDLMQAVIGADLRRFGQRQGLRVDWSP